MVVFFRFKQVAFAISCIPLRWHFFPHFSSLDCFALPILTYLYLDVLKTKACVDCLFILPLLRISAVYVLSNGFFAVLVIRKSAYSLHV